MHVREFVSDRALDRGYDQCGSLGSGNHFLEVQVVDRVFDDEAARALGLAKDGVCVMIHSGSRGLGYQVCDDALRAIRGVPEKYGIDLPDRQLACAPVHSPEGQHYLGAMRAAANFAWGNRQLLMWQAREVFERIFGRSWEDLGMDLVYDVAHNIAKFEDHDVDGGPSACGSIAKGRRALFLPITPNSRAIPTDRSAGADSRRHGPGKLGAVGSAGQHGTDLRQRLPRRGAALEPHGSREASQGRKIEHELRSRGVIAQARSGRVWPRNSRTPKGSRSGRRRRPPGRPGPKEGRPPPPDRRNQRLNPLPNFFGLAPANRAGKRRRPPAYRRSAGRRYPAFRERRRRGR